MMKEKGTANKSDEQWSLVIEPGRAAKNYWKDLWRYRELFYILSWRDIKVRYKQTVIGAAWSIIRPLLTTIIFTIIFSRVARLKSRQAPYALMVFAGMLPWQFFSNALSESSNSLIGNANLITKVYFPRLIIPASCGHNKPGRPGHFFHPHIVYVCLVWLHAFLAHHFPALICFTCIYLFIWHWIILTAVNVKYRDFRYIIPFIVQFGLYISPVGFNSFVVSEKYRMLYSLNPMVGVIDGFRWCLLGDPMHWRSFVVSVVIILSFLVIGIYYFRKMEKSFADNI